MQGSLPPGRAGLHLDLEGSRSAQVATETARVTGGTVAPPSWWTDEVCTVVNGHTALTTSGGPFEVVADREKHVGDASVAQFGEDGQPELAPSPTGPGPQPEDV